MTDDSGSFTDEAQKRFKSDEASDEARLKPDIRAIEDGDDRRRLVAENFRPLDRETLMAANARAASGPAAIPTPFEQVNDACGDLGGHRGFARGWHNLIVGLTSTGKSLLALQWMGTALQAGYNACYISNEMSRDQLINRLYAQIGGERIRSIEPGQSLDPEARQRAMEKVLELEGVPYVNQRPVRNAEGLERVIRYHVNDRNCHLFVIDYVQLVGADDARNSADRTRIVSHRTQGLCRELRVTSVALSQFNRKQQADQPPSIFRLKGGSSLEQDADVILLIDHYHSDYNEHRNEKFSYLEVAKNRHGPTPTIPVLWEYEHLTTQELHEVPSWVNRSQTR